MIVSSAVRGFNHIAMLLIIGTSLSEHCFQLRYQEDSLSVEQARSKLFFSAMSFGSEYIVYFVLFALNKTFIYFV